MSVKKVSDLSPKENLRLRDAGRRFINSYRASNYQESYVRSLEETIAYLALYSEEHGWPTVPHITTEHLEEYFAYSRTRQKGYGQRKSEKGQTPSSSYLNRQYRQLHCFWGWMADPQRRLAAENVLDVMRAPRVEENIVPTLSDDQLADLLALVNPKLARTRKDAFRLKRNNALLYLFVDSPGRLREIATMQVDDVILDEEKVRVMGKGRRQRFMPIGPAAQRAMQDYLEARETLAPLTQDLWVSEQGRALRSDWISSLLKRLKKRAKISRLHPHMFRHTYAMDSLRKQMPDEVLKIIGGWKKIPDTYFRTLGFDDAAEFHRKMSPGDRLSQQTRTRRKKGPGGDKGPGPRGRL
ncbi:MAG: tyrosine-type recombinase/integrase [Chloroflexi bacterium]|nr:tyrosine-type recombinase/integrase [Chloroflexota bacterium]